VADEEVRGLGVSAADHPRHDQLGLGFAFVSHANGNVTGRKAVSLAIPSYG
jgi:hypothetical protein